MSYWCSVQNNCFIGFSYFFCNFWELFGGIDVEGCVAHRRMANKLAIEKVNTSSLRT